MRVNPRDTPHPAGRAVGFPDDLWDQYREKPSHPPRGSIFSPDGWRWESTTGMDRRGRVGRDSEPWFAWMHGMVIDRSRSHDVVCPNTGEMYEVKTVSRVSHHPEDSAGYWRFRRPQHRTLVKNDGYYALCYVHRPPSSARRWKHYVKAYAVLPACDMSHRVGLYDRWYEVIDESLGQIEIADVRWSEVLEYSDIVNNCQRQD